MKNTHQIMMNGTGELPPKQEVDVKNKGGWATLLVSVVCLQQAI
jgi:hypothetical protein